MSDNGRLMTAAEVARRCGVSDRTVRKWIDAGVLISVELPNGKKRIEEADYELFRRSLRKKPDFAENSAADD